MLARSVPSEGHRRGSAPGLSPGLELAVSSLYLHSIFILGGSLRPHVLLCPGYQSHWISTHPKVHVLT